jgi:hypothetical protein
MTPLDDSGGLPELSTTIPHEPSVWGKEFTADEVNSPAFGVATVSTDSRLTGATFDPNTGYWMSDVLLLPDGSTRHAPWKPPYRWHREPIKRLRVELARWKARR